MVPLTFLSQRTSDRLGATRADHGGYDGRLLLLRSIAKEGIRRTREEVACIIDESHKAGKLIGHDQRIRGRSEEVYGIVTVPHVDKRTRRSPGTPHVDSTGGAGKP